MCMIRIVSKVVRVVLNIRTFYTGTGSLPEVVLTVVTPWAIHPHSGRPRVGVPPIIPLET